MNSPKFLPPQTTSLLDEWRSFLRIVLLKYPVIFSGFPPLSEQKGYIPTETAAGLLCYVCHQRDSAWTLPFAAPAPPIHYL